MQHTWPRSRILVVDARSLPMDTGISSIEGSDDLTSCGSKWECGNTPRFNDSRVL